MSVMVSLKLLCLMLCLQQNDVIAADVLNSPILQVRLSPFSSEAPGSSYLHKAEIIFNVYNREMIDRHDDVTTEEYRQLRKEVSDIVSQTFNQTDSSLWKNLIFKAFLNPYLQNGP